MGRFARILDLQNGTVLQLPVNNGITVIGLTASDELICCDQESLQESEIVLDICSLKSMPDGHWLIPSNYLPTSLNDIDIKGHVLLDHGTIITIGDRNLRFTTNVDASSTQTASAENEIDDEMDMSNSIFRENENERHRDNMGIPVSFSCAFDPASMLENMLSQSKAFRRPPSQPVSPNRDLLNFLGTSNGLADMTAAIVSQHISLHTTLTLTALEIDRLFLSFELVTTWEEVCFQTFLCEYEELFSRGESSSTNDVQGYRPKSLSCVHAPVIHLLTDLLTLTLDPIENNVLWLRILAELCFCPRALPPLIKCRTAASVLGCISARNEVECLQEHGCKILARIAEYKPAHGEKGPIREGGVQLVVQAMHMHITNIRVVLPAVSCLANLLKTYSTLAIETVNTMEFVPIEQQREILIKIMGVLDFIEEMAVPIVTTIPEEFLTDSIVRKNVLSILSYFHDNMDALNGSEENINDKDDLTPDPVIDNPAPTCDVAESVNTHADGNDTSSTEYDTLEKTEEETPEHAPYTIKSSIIDDVELFSDEESTVIEETLSENLNTESDQYEPKTERIVQMRTTVQDEHEKEKDVPENPNTSQALHKDRIYVPKKKYPKPPDTKRKRNIFDKLKRTKPKARSLLATEYTQSPPVKKSVELQSSSLLFGGTVKRPIYDSVNLESSADFEQERAEDQPVGSSSDNFVLRRPDKDNRSTHDLYSSRTSTDLSTGDNQGFSTSNDRPSSSSTSTSSTLSFSERESETPMELNENVSHYVKIFGRMSKKKKRGKKKINEEGEETAHLAPTEDQGGFVANFMRRTRQLFKDGRGKYDITDAAVRASMTEQRSSYLPLSLEDHGHLCDLQNLGDTGCPDVLY